MRLMDNAPGEASLPSKAEEVLRKFFNARLCDRRTILVARL
jgi:hypothetical protein